MENKENCKHKAPTSYHMQDPNIVFKKLNVNIGDVFLDIGCGAGDYSVHASKLVGDSGKVYAFDKSEESIKLLKEKFTKLGINNIQPQTSDITKELSLKDNIIDVCLISTVLHAIDFDKYEEGIFKEIKRVIKPSGRLAIIECSKKDLSFGPPENIRLDLEKIEQSAEQFGFRKIKVVDLGFNYLCIFEKE